MTFYLISCLKYGDPITKENLLTEIRPQDKSFILHIMFKRGYRWNKKSKRYEIFSAEEKPTNIKG